MRPFLDASTDAAIAQRSLKSVWTSIVPIPAKWALIVEVILFEHFTSLCQIANTSQYYQLLGPFPTSQSTCPSHSYAATPSSTPLHQAMRLEMSQSPGCCDSVDSYQCAGGRWWRRESKEWLSHIVQSLVDGYAIHGIDVHKTKDF